jgi:alkylated DNA repair protein (DNA oxidative demethylase)
VIPGDAMTLERIELGANALVLRKQVLAHERALLAEIEAVLSQAPLRQMETPNGRMMSVAMSNCGSLGWISDRRGYRYSPSDPLTGAPWPLMPELFVSIASEAAATIGYEEYLPDACLINYYRPGAALSLHQDRDEHDLTAPIVSISLGMSAIFMFGGFARRDPVRTIELHHSDVVVWGGKDRLRYHGIRRLCGAAHPLTGEARINLTFRRAG